MGSEMCIRDRAKALNLILSRKKFVIGDELPFAGYIISSKGISPNQERVSAIKDFPTPVDTTGIKSFMGLANQLSFFIPDFAHQTRGMRALLGKNTVFQWLPEHQEEFDRVKTILTDKMLTCHFDPKLPVHLLTDASRHHGLGYALCQPSSDGSLRLITCGSKSLTPTQQRYATVELECLGIMWAIQKNSFYLKGLPSFLVLTDHRPLEGIFKKCLFDLPNARLQRCLLYTSPSPRDLSTSRMPSSA